MWKPAADATRLYHPLSCPATLGAPYWWIPIISAFNWDTLPSGPLLQATWRFMNDFSRQRQQFEPLPLSLVGIPVFPSAPSGS